MFKVRKHDNKSLRWWFNNRENIDFNPPYQRKGNLWSEYNKAYLIDSIINGFDIPKIYLADFTVTNSRLNYSRKQYAVIDGRQRLEAIFDFFSSKLSLNDDFTYFSDQTIQLRGLTHADIRRNYPSIADEYEEFQLDVMSVITDDEAKINDLFIRLNTSKPLTGAEIRNAMSGVVPELIRKIADHEFFKTRIRFKTSRGEDKNTAAKLLLLEFRGKIVDTKKTHLDRFVEEGVQSQTDDLQRAADRVDFNLNLLCDVFALQDKLLSSQGLIPVYYWLTRSIGDVKNIRRGIVHFEAMRLENRRIAKDDPTRADQTLLSYDVMNRSTNDQNSIKGRFDSLYKYILNNSELN